jgi:two-component system sensor histidine kinase TctE
VRPLKERLNSLFELVRNEQDAKDRLISNVAHQLRTPLTTIRVRTDLALNANDPQVHLEALDREAERAGVLASQLMRLESDGGAAELGELDLAALLSSLLEDWSMTFVKAGVKLKFEVAEGAEDRMIIGSSLLIEEVLSNLLDNTLQHANAKSVTIAVNGSVMEVWDDGTGVDERSVGWVFERFYKASEGAEAGYGLGLSIVREFATRMGAKVRAENRNGLWVAVAFRVAETGVSTAL